MKSSRKSTGIVRSSLVDMLKSTGIDTTQTQLVAEVGLLPAGERDHYDGTRVKVFHPVAIQLDFIQPGVEQPIAVARFESLTVRRREDSTLLEDADFNRHVAFEAPFAGAERFLRATGQLMREIVSKHREITGQISSAYERIEVDPAVIAQITSKRFKLQIGLERLAKYLALDDEWFDLLCDCDDSESKIRMGEIEFEKLMLKEGFIKQPCSRDLYTQLRTEFVELGFVRGMEFMEYYQWFRRSEGIFEASGKISDESAAAMDTVIRSWHASGNSSDDIRYWLNRNFKIHPRHREAVSHFIDEVVAGQGPAQERPCG